MKDTDSEHLQKFINDLQSDYPIHFYRTFGFDRKEEKTEARVFITNKHMTMKLYEEYGIVPRREFPSYLLSIIPQELIKFFILGLFDGDGSFTAYGGSYGDKLNVTFGGCEELLMFIDNFLVENNVINLARNSSQKRKFYQRHKEKDGSWRSLSYAGVSQGMKILNYLYKNSPIYLDRKYQKYLSLPYHRK